MVASTGKPSAGWPSKSPGTTAPRQFNLNKSRGLVQFQGKNRVKTAFTRRGEPGRCQQGQLRRTAKWPWHVRSQRNAVIEPSDQFGLACAAPSHPPLPTQGRGFLSFFFIRRCATPLIARTSLWRALRSSPCSLTGCLSQFQFMVHAACSTSRGGVISVAQRARAGMHRTRKSIPNMNWLFLYQGSSCGQYEAIFSSKAMPC